MRVWQAKTYVSPVPAGWLRKAAAGCTQSKVSGAILSFSQFLMHGRILTGGMATFVKHAEECADPVETLAESMETFPKVMETF